MHVCYDMRNLEQPVVMNSNPFLSAPTNGLSLKAVDQFGGVVSVSMMVASSGSGNTTQTTTQQTGVNNVQVKAFEKIGGDQAMVITDVTLKNESMGINLLMAMAEGVVINATGTVSRIEGNRAKPQGGVK